MLTTTDVIAAFVLVIVAIVVAYLGAKLIAELLIRLLPQSLLPPHLHAHTAPEDAGSKNPGDDS